MQRDMYVCFETFGEINVGGQTGGLQRNTSIARAQLTAERIWYFTPLTIGEYFYSEMK
jgi:hypothetical protein